MVMYGITLCPVIYGASTLKKHNNANRRSHASRSRSRPTTQSVSQPRSAPTQSVRPPPHVEILPSAPSLNTQTNEPPFVSKNASSFASKSPPSYESTLTEPPPYEVAITSTDV